MHWRLRQKLCADRGGGDPEGSQICGEQQQQTQQAGPQPQWNGEDTRAGSWLDELDIFDGAANFPVQGIVYDYVEDTRAGGLHFESYKAPSEEAKWAAAHYLQAVGSGNSLWQRAQWPRPRRAFGRPGKSRASTISRMWRTATWTRCFIRISWRTFEMHGDRTGVQADLEGRWEVASSRGPRRSGVPRPCLFKIV